jgi:hypothetical protein
VKKVSIDLSYKDIEYVKGMFGDAKKAINNMLDELCKRLAYMGMEKAKLHFFEALYDGVNDAEVTVEKRSDGYAVMANGNSVLFIEFGAGIHYPNNHPEANGIEHGAYGKGNGKKDYWFYTGQPGNAGGERAYGRINTTITHGNPANMPMYNTVKDLEGELERMIKEVFDLYQ